MPCCPLRRVWIIALAVIAAVLPHPLAAIDAKLIDAVPTDAIAAILVDTAHPTSDAPSTIDVGANIVGQASRMGLLSAVPEGEGLALDIFATLPVLSRQPFALVLTDIRARTVGDGGHRLAGTKLGLIVATSGHNDPIAAVVQRFLNRYTTSGPDTIQRTRYDGHSIHRLTSSRWPPWVVIEWGPVGENYVIAIGDGTFLRLAKSISGAERETEGRNRLANAYETLGGAGATWMWHVDFRLLVQALSPSMGTMPQRVIDALGWADSPARTWAIMPRERAVCFESIRHGEQSPERIGIAVPATSDEIASGLIPEGADAYAVLNWNPRKNVTRLRDAYLLARSPTNQRRWHDTWSSLEEELDISIERDLLHQLGGRLVLHNDPKHPLGIGPLCTVQIPIAGSTRLVRSTIDSLLSKWQRELRSKGNALVVEHADDGIWYLKYGIYGPALAVLDRWIVISFSPMAVRYNVSRLTHRTAQLPLERTDP